jgi:hypothetical protein
MPGADTLWNPGETRDVPQSTGDYLVTTGRFDLAPEALPVSEPMKGPPASRAMRRSPVSKRENDPQE